MLEWAQFVLGWPAQMERSRGEMGGHPCMLTELPSWQSGFHCACWWMLLLTPFCCSEGCRCRRRRPWRRRS